MKELFNKAGIVLDDAAEEKFRLFSSLLEEYNKKFNLTAINEPEEVIIKHFIDSAMGAKLIPNGAKVVDVGAGAGFPSIPLKILRDDLDFTLVDSLNKRVGFLDVVAEKLALSKVKNLHLRAEEAGQGALRETFDVAVARAVASMDVLSEYCLPLIKVGGIFLAYKANAEEELKSGLAAIKLLGGEVKNIEKFALPDGSERCIIVIKKVFPTPKKYPRGQNKPRIAPIKG